MVNHHELSPNEKAQIKRSQRPRNNCLAAISQLGRKRARDHLGMNPEEFTQLLATQNRLEADWVETAKQLGMTEEQAKSDDISEFLCTIPSARGEWEQAAIPIVVTNCRHLKAYFRLDKWDLRMLSGSESSWVISVLDEMTTPTFEQAIRLAESLGLTFAQAVTRDTDISKCRQLEHFLSEVLAAKAANQFLRGVVGPNRYL